MKPVLTTLVFFFFMTSPLGAFAQTPSLAMTVSPQPTPTNAPVNYTLPYPGILADNPLYPLKALRDNIIGWLISNPLKKSSFDLLQADKRLQIGVYLLKEDKSKAPLAVSTISKGENYLTEAVDKIQQARKQGESTTETLRRLRIAILKHEEVIQALESQVPGDQRAALTEMVQHDIQLEQQVLHIK